MMSFKYSLILLRYSATDSVLFLSPLLYIQLVVTLKIAYSYWSIIVFFFFMLKTTSNIFKYSIFN